jgi:hypothetical protein
MPNSQAACQAAWQDRLAPCGTAAAARRHYRRHEPLDAACVEANRQDTARRAGRPGAWGSLSDPLSAVRNGLPIVAYRWRERRYPWAQRVLAAAEAAYGVPADDEEEAMAS